MGAPSRGWRALAAFFGVALGVALLFALVALVALQPRDGLAWVHVPDLGADLRVDAGLQTKPLKDTVVAAVLSDRALDGLTATGLSVAPALAAVPQQPTVAMSQPPAARPVTTPDASQPAPAATPGPALAPTPTPTPTAAPTPTPTPAPTPTPTPTPTLTPTPSPTPAPTPSPTPSPMPTPTPSVRFALTWATESLTQAPKNPHASGRCSLTTVTATGNFTTNGAGGLVYYQWVHYDSQGNQIGVTPETPIAVAAGDVTTHSVVADQFVPLHAGSDQLVFLNPAYSVPAQSWNCVG